MLLKSSAMIETGGNLIEQGEGYTEDASIHPSHTFSMFAAWLRVQSGAVLVKHYALSIHQPRLVFLNSFF